nr:unnamed protein product [Callosobruchus analis]
MCDIGKAFDCVSHESLISKLEYYGFRGNELSLFISYLANRTQYVQCGNESSPLLPINHGVPQGSILGPILLIIYINDLPTAVDGTCVLFADDTTILTDNAVDDPCSSAKQWFTANGLMLNAEKTQSILFSSNKKIDKSVPVKLLGVQLDTSLTWLPHIDMLSSRISSQIFVLRQLSLCLPYSALKLVYFALIHSHLAYNTMLWGNSSHAIRVFRLQKTAVRILSRVPFDASCRELFRLNGIMTLPSIYIFQTLIHIHKNLGTFTTPAFNHNYDTRNAQSIIPLRSRLRMTQMNRVNIYIYNKLDSLFKIMHIKDMSLNAFKVFSKKFLLQHCFYTIDEYLNL